LSTGENKPGMRNISDLKARLGMLSKNVGTRPDGTPATGEVGADTEAAVGMDTQVVRLPPADLERPVPASEPAPPAAAPAPPRPSLDVKPAAPPPSATSTQTGLSPLALGSASELFRKPEPAPSAPPPPAARPAAQQPPAPAAPPAEPALDHPLQMGVYPEDRPGPNFGGPVQLNADDQDFIASVEGVRSMKRKVIVGVAAFTLLLGVFLGFIIGNSKIQRQLINAQIDRAVIIKNQLIPLMDKFDALVPVLERMDMNHVSWDVVDAIPEDLPKIDTGAIMGGRAPLTEDLMRNVGATVSALDAVFQAAREHRRITLKRDRAELEALDKGQSFEQNDYFAVYFTPRDPKTKPLEYVPPKGEIVAVVGKPHPNEKGDDNVIPIRTRQGKEEEVSLHEVLVMAKEDLFQGGGGNALASYKHRIEDLRRLAEDFRNIEPGVRESLNNEAGRSKVFSF
jgi:hypothetical protein